MILSTASQQAYQYCLHFSQQYDENFPTASRLIQRPLRPAVAAIYAFARSADDMADEGEDTPAQRLSKLDDWQAQLDACLDSHAKAIKNPIFIALADCIQRHQLSKQAFDDLLKAFRFDAANEPIDNVNTLQRYCQQSANPIGQLLLELHDCREPQALAASNALCTALQYVNHWQDLSIDLARGRCFLPHTWLQKANSSPSQLLQQPDSDSAQQLLQKAYALAEQELQLAKPLVHLAPKTLRLQIAASWQGGSLILKKTRQGNPLKKRPHLNKFNWACSIPSILRLAYSRP